MIQLYLISSHRKSQHSLTAPDFKIPIARHVKTDAVRRGIGYICDYARPVGKLQHKLGAPYCNEDGTATETLLNFTDHINLYNWAFDEFEYTLVIGKNQQIMQADVEKGYESDKVGIIATEDYYTLLPKSLDITTIQQVKPTLRPIEAPVQKGMLVGKLELKLNGETLTKLKLVTERGVELDMAEYYKEKIGNIIAMPQFIAIAVLFGVLIIMLAVTRMLRARFYRAYAERNRRRKNIQMAPRQDANRSGSNRSNTNRRR